MVIPLPGTGYNCGLRIVLRQGTSPGKVTPELSSLKPAPKQGIDRHDRTRGQNASPKYRIYFKYMVVMYGRVNYVSDKQKISG